MFDQFYQQASDQLKLSFLQKIIEQNDHIKEQFINFYLEPKDKQLALTVTDPDDFIYASKDLIKEDLESIKFKDLDWNSYAPRNSGYVSHDDAFEYLAEEEIGRVIGFHAFEVERYCSLKHFDLAFLYMISIYRACLEAKLDEDYAVLEFPLEMMLQNFDDHLQSCLPIFKAIQIPEDQLFTIAVVLFDQHNEINSDDSSFLTFFETYLLSLLHSGVEAGILLDVMEEKDKAACLPWLFTELHRKTGGTECFEMAALKHYKSSIHVAKDLLELYRSSDNLKFRNIAKQLWNNGLYHHECAELYFDVLDPKQEPALYLEITLFLNKKTFTKKYYEIIQVLMPEDERLGYLRTLQNKPPAYVLAMCMEGKITEALDHARIHTDRWNIIDTMTPCLKYAPQQALIILSQKVEDQLFNERGRNFYATIAKILKVAIEIPEIQKQTEVLVNRIVYSHGRLKALRDELRAAGVI